MGNAIPWWLFPLRLISAADRCLVELTEGDRVLTFAHEADECFTLEFHSFRRELMPQVFQHLRSGGVTTEPAEVIDRDATFFEFTVFCDGAKHDEWHVLARRGRECPADLVVVAEALSECSTGE